MQRWFPQRCQWLTESLDGEVTTLVHLCKLTLAEPMCGKYDELSSDGTSNWQAEHGRIFKALSAGHEMSSAKAMGLGRPTRVVVVAPDAGAGSPW